MRPFSRRSLLTFTASAAAAAAAAVAAVLAGCSGSGGSDDPPVVSRETRQVGLWAGQSARLAAHVLRLGPDGPVPREGNLTPEVRYRVTSQNAEGYQVRYFTGPGFATDLGAVNVRVTATPFAVGSAGFPKTCSIEFALSGPPSVAVGEGEFPSDVRLRGTVDAIHAALPASGGTRTLLRATGGFTRYVTFREHILDQFDLTFDGGGVGTGTYRSFYRDDSSGNVTAAVVTNPKETLSFEQVTLEPDGTLRATFDSTLGAFTGTVACRADGSGTIAGTAPEAGRLSVAWDTQGGGTLSIEGRSAASERLNRVYGDWWYAWTVPPAFDAADPASQLYDPWYPW